MSTLSFNAPHFPIVQSRFIETGMYAGDSMAEAAKCEFNTLDGIEIAPEWVAHCQAKFADDPRVTVYAGSSTAILPSILRDEPTTFWLDAHFTGDPLRPQLMDPAAGECPLLEELRIITEFPWTTTPTILIDDSHMYRSDFWQSSEAKNFTQAQWPTLEQIKAVLEPKYRVEEYLGALWIR